MTSFRINYTITLLILLNVWNVPWSTPRATISPGSQISWSIQQGSESPSVSESSSVSPTASTTASPSMLASAEALAGSLQFDYHALGCNTVPLSTVLTFNNGTSIAPCINCNTTSGIVQSTLLNMQPGSKVCVVTEMISEYNSTNHASPKNFHMETLILNSYTVEYPVAEVYTGAVNFVFKEKADCACPGGVDELTKCFKGFSYCEHPMCTDFYTDGVYSDCIANNVGILSKGSQVCLSIDYSQHEEATFFRVKSPVYANAIVTTGHLWKNDTTGPCSIPPYCGNAYALNFNWQTFPVNTELVNTPSGWPGTFNFTGPTGFPVPLTKTSMKMVGTFTESQFPGDVIFAQYNGELYYVPNVNDINSYDPTKCGWMKKDTKGVHHIDKIQLANRVSIDTKSCLDDTFNVSSDITKCNTASWIPINEYLALWGNTSQNFSDIMSLGLFSLEVTKGKNSVISWTGETFQTFLSYTYGIINFNCTGINNFQASTVHCNVTYDTGATYLIVTILTSANAPVYGQQVIVGGSGLDTINFTIPSTVVATAKQICFNSNSQQRKCQTIVVQSNDLYVKDPTWNYNIVNGNGPIPTQSEGSGFDFWDLGTWNWWQQLALWGPLGLILLGIVGVSVLLVVFRANILANIRNFNRWRQNRKYKRLNPNDQL